MSKIQVKNIIEYWQKTAAHDYKTMLWLLKGKRYSDALFYGHIILEKILKGLVVEETKKPAPHIHNLTKLAEISGCPLTEDQWRILDATNKFNIRCRYPDYKLRFYQQYNKRTIVKPEIDKIQRLYQILWKELEQKIK
ncbi:MAG: HEPN domain-containing protein [Patescibacteria group bacterium]